MKDHPIRVKDYLILIKMGIRIKATKDSIPVLNVLVCGGYLNYDNGLYRKNWRTEFYLEN